MLACFVGSVEMQGIVSATARELPENIFGLLSYSFVFGKILLL
jgi:hypothetical protein